MKGFGGLIKRNLLLFFKDKQAVIFSLLTSIIVLALYLLFLKDSFSGAMNDVVNSFPGLSDLISPTDIDMYSNLVLLIGILGSAMITVPFNCLTLLVKDREDKIDYDVLATPIRRGQIITSYFVSAAISSIILTGVILTIGLTVVGAQGDLHLKTCDIVSAYGIVALGSVSATALFIIIMMLFKSSSASGAFFGMLSAASGFVIGAYIPISQFSKSVQTVCNLFPASHVTIVLRNVLMNGLLDYMDSSIGGLDNGMYVSTIKEIFCFKAHMFSYDMEVGSMLCYVAIGIVICVVAQIVVYSKTYKKK